MAKTSTGPFRLFVHLVVAALLAAGTGARGCGQCDGRVRGVPGPRRLRAAAGVQPRRGGAHGAVVDGGATRRSGWRRQARRGVGAWGVVVSGDSERF
jgi:hypothetical protein